MIPVFRKGHTVQVTLERDTGTPKTVYIVELYSVEHESVALARAGKITQTKVAEGHTIGSTEVVEARHSVIREAFAKIVREIQNEAGPDGKPRTITSQADIVEHFQCLPVDWFEDLAAAIRRPAAISAEMGKG